MSLLFCESFDWIGTTGRTEMAQKWSSPGSGMSFPADADYSTSYGRTGKGVRMIANYGMQIGVQTPGATIIVGAAVKRAADSTGTQGIYFGQDSLSQVGVRFETNGGFSWVPPGSATWAYLGGAGSVPLGAWRYVEIKVVIGDSGSITIKVDGATVVSATGLDTKYTTASYHTYVWFVGTTAAHTIYYDDIYICDDAGAQCNDFLGDVRVVGLLPSTGNGSNTDFTCSTGTDHGALVDEVGPNGDTDYVSSSTLNHVDTWNFPALGYTGVIKAVAMNLNAKKIDAGTRAIAAVTRPASTNRVHATNHYLSTSYLNKQSIWELNPEDSAAWEVADVDGAEFGVKVTV